MDILLKHGRYSGHIQQNVGGPFFAMFFAREILHEHILNDKVTCCKYNDDVAILSNLENLIPWRYNLI